MSKQTLVTPSVSVEPASYDHTLKAWFGEEATQIIPCLLPGIQIGSDRNVEIDRSTLRADLVYNCVWDGEEQIVEMELQTKAERNTLARLLQYAAGLHVKHGLPVIPILLLPFQTHVPVIPYEVRCQSRAWICMYPIIICLWKEDARLYLSEKRIFMYTMLPVMRHVSVPLLKEALSQMQQHYSQRAFGDRLARFHQMVEKSKTLKREEKEEIREVLQVQYHYDWFYDENPEVKKRVRRGRQEARQEGKQEGLVEGLQKALISLLQSRFPVLVASALPQIQQIKQAEELEALMPQLLSAPDEQEVLRLLHLPSA